MQLVFEEILLKVAINQVTYAIYCSGGALSRRIISAKKPGYSLLCSENIDNLSLGDQLRVMRLRTGLIIEQAARAIGVERRIVMNYELGKVKRVKREVVSKLIELYKSGK